MATTQIYCQTVAKQPSLAEHKVRSTPVEEGKKLLLPILGDKEPTRLCPEYCRRYSRRQLRTMQRRVKNIGEKIQGKPKQLHDDLSHNKIRYRLLRSEMSIIDLRVNRGKFQ